MKLPKPFVNTDSAHSKYSPSGSKRWLECAASIQMEEAIPREETTNFYAEEGTAAHELGAFCLEEELEPESQYGKEFNGFIVDKEMANQVKKYTKYVTGLLTWENQLWIESQVNLSFLHEDMFGTADAIIVSPTSVEIIDLKYGKGVVVEVERNTQLMIYALGVLAHLAKHGVKFVPDSLVKLTIVQPRAPHIDGPIRSWEISIADLRKFKNEVVECIQLTKLDEPPFGPGDEQCRWCAAAPTCKAYASHNLDLAKLEFADFAKSPREFKNSFADINSLSMDDFTRILKHAKSLEQWLKNCVEHATSLLKAGKPVTGYKLVFGRSIRAWDDFDNVASTLLNHGIAEEDLYISKIKSPSQMEKFLSSEEWNLIQDQVVKPKGKIVMAPETDSRQAVSPNAEAASEWANEEF